MSEPESIRLLSLDGGGIRGLSSLIILRHLMKQVNPSNPPKPCEFFHLIGGTSTGGLIAIMLGRFGMDVDECIQKYLRLSSHVFQLKRHKMDLLGRGKDFWAANGRYRSEGLADQFKLEAQELEGDEDATLFSSQGACKIFVCAQAKSLNTSTRIRSYRNLNSVDNLSTKDCKIWEAARATSAASGFFDPVEIGNETFVDGATGCNNPVEEVWKEANSIWGDLNQRVQCIVSIGTGKPEPRPFGDHPREIVKTMIKTATETETTERRFFEHHVAYGLDGRYFRFNVEHGLQKVKLDDVEKLGIIESATQQYLEGDRVQHQTRLFAGSKASRDVLVTETKRNEYLKWLTRVDSGRLHNAASGQRLNKDTGRWFLDGHFESWREMKGSFTWLNGKAGAGKTILCSSVIDKILTEKYGTCCYFYFSFQASDAIDAYQIICSVITAILRDLIQVHPAHRDGYTVPKAFRDLFEQYYPFGEPRMADLETTLIALLQQAKDVFIVIDGLDEVPRKAQGDVLQTLINITKNGNSLTHILLSSRPETYIEDVLFYDRSINIFNLPVDVYGVNRDIRMHAGKMLLQASYQRWPDKLKTDVIDHITTKANGVFRWASLQLEALSHKEREKDIRRALKELPKDLQETYDRILQHIENQNQTEEAMMILRWLAYSMRPLTIAEVAELAAFDINDPAIPLEDAVFKVEFNPGDRYPHFKSCLQLVSGLVSCEDVAGSPHLSVVKFAHFSVLEYLESKNVTLSRFKLEPLSGNLLILKSCLGYIAHYEWARQHATLSPPYPLLVYALVRWREHKRLVRDTNKFNWANESTSETATIMGAVEQIYETGYTEKERALEIRIWKGGRNQMGNLESEADLSPARNMSDVDIGKRTSRPDQVMVHQQQLLDWGLSEDSISVLGCTDSVWHWLIPGSFDSSHPFGLALHKSAAAGCLGIVKILLDAGPGFTRSYCRMSKQEGRTPLHDAARKQYKNLHFWKEEELEEIRNIKSNVAVISSLVSAGFSCSDQDMFGRTPLHYAAGSGTIDEFRAILEMGRESLNILDKEKQSALSVAAEAGHDSIVRLLVEQDDVLMDERDRYGQSPLSLAASHGNASIVELLLAQGQVDPNLVDQIYRTPLILAAGIGNEAVVKVLLSDERVDIHQKDLNGQTAISLANSCGHQRILQVISDKWRLNGAGISGLPILQQDALPGSEEAESVLSLRSNSGLQLSDNLLINSTPVDMKALSTLDFPGNSMELAAELNHEVGIWYLEFSPDGKRLATSGRSSKVVIWDVATLRVLFILETFYYCVHSVSWKPDSSMIVVCGPGRVNAELWDANNGLRVKTLILELEAGESFASSWERNGKFIMIATERKPSMWRWNVEDNEICYWGGEYGIRDLGVSPDGNWVLAVDNHGALNLYSSSGEWCARKDFENPAASLTITADSQNVLVTKKCGKLSLLEIPSLHVVREYLGHRSSTYLLRRSFWGEQDCFVLDPSDEEYFSIWNRETGEQVMRVDGNHGGTNHVTPNPVNPTMLASCGDDGKVKIWLATSCSKAHIDSVLKKERVVVRRVKSLLGGFRRSLYGYLQLREQALQQRVLIGPKDILASKNIELLV